MVATGRFGLALPAGVVTLMLQVGTASTPSSGPVPAIEAPPATPIAVQGRGAVREVPPTPYLQVVLVLQLFASSRPPVALVPLRDAPRAEGVAPQGARVEEVVAIEQVFVREVAVVRQTRGVATRHPSPPFDAAA